MDDWARQFAAAVGIYADLPPKEEKMLWKIVRDFHPGDGGRPTVDEIVRRIEKLEGLVDGRSEFERLRLRKLGEAVRGWEVDVEVVLLCLRHNVA